MENSSNECCQCYWSVVFDKYFAPIFMERGYTLEGVVLMFAHNVTPISETINKCP